MIPREHQLEVREAVFDYFGTQDGNPVVSAPTASGKAFMCADTIRIAMENHPPMRALMLTHVKELLQQNYDELKAIWPEAPAGLYSAGLNKRQSHKQITIAGIQSIYKKGHLLNWIDLIICDECHMISPKTNTMYQRLLTTLRKVNPNLRVLGFSATPWRTADGHLVSQGGIFTDICCDISMKRLIADGYLSAPVSKGSKIQADMKGVKTIAGDYSKKEMAERFDRESLTTAAINEVCELGKDRKKWLLFCASVKHAHHVRDELRKRGISCETVDGTTDKKERANILERFKNGDLQAVTNFAVLTTGFNNPKIDLIVVLRSTKSSGLWVQLLGRGARVVYAPGYDLSTAEKRLLAIADGPKPNFLVLDYGGNLERHGPVDKITVEIKNVNGKKTCEIHVMPTKLCPNCFDPVHARSLECPACGYVFPAEDSAKHERKASEANVLSQDPQWFDVKKVSYFKHSKLGKPDMIKAMYFCGLHRFTDYFCLFHGGYAQEKALQKWCARGGKVPVNIEEALTQGAALATPKRILVDVDNKYPEIKRYEY